MTDVVNVGRPGPTLTQARAGVPKGMGEQVNTTATLTEADDGEIAAVSSGATIRRRQRGLSQRGRRVLAPIVTFVLFIATWYALSGWLLSDKFKLLVPAPHEVFFEAFLESSSRSELIDGVLVTGRVAIIGLAAAILLGTSLAVVMSQARWLEDALFPYAVMLQVLPVLAIVPLLGLLFGFDLKSRVIVCTIIALFPIITNTLFGLKSADPGLHGLFTLQRSSRLVRMVKLQIPAALPAIFTGWRIAAGLAVIGAIVGDFFFRQGQAGLGILLDRYRARLQTDRLYAAIVYSAILGIAAFLFFGWLSRRTVGRWYQEHE